MLTLKNLNFEFVVDSVQGQGEEIETNFISTKCGGQLGGSR